MWLWVGVALLLPLPAGGLADLTLVFFDPMGQALCKRTLDIVGRWGMPGWAWSPRVGGKLCNRPVIQL